MSEHVKRFRYEGTGGALLGLGLGNAILTLLTLGIYTFWARSKVREFHYGHTDLGGDRFAYHGTGTELFRGYLKASGIVILLALGLGIASALTGAENAPASTQFAILAVFYFGIFILGIVAVNGSRRYRLSRSSWRGIRFSYHGEAEAFGKLILRGFGLSLITLGLYSPWFQNQRRAFLVNNARFGSEPFGYDAPADPLAKEWFKALLLTIPTLGLIWIWYGAFRHRYFWSNTHFAGARFESSVSGGEILGLSLMNMLLVIVTIGIATPWVVTRTHAFWSDRLALVGAVDWAAIQQRAQAANATGEGLADSMDIDVGIGV
jgi:uncharacterized membrane protein YjgN (DUF898 family)